MAPFLGCLVHTSITILTIRHIEPCAQKLLGGVDPFLFPPGSLEVLEFILRMKNWSEKMRNNNKNNNYNTYSSQSCMPPSRPSVNSSG